MITNASNDNTVIEQAPVVEEVAVAQEEVQEEAVELTSTFESTETSLNNVSAEEENELVDDQW